MILPLRPGHSAQIPGSVPLRRRVIVLGASEAGVLAAFHLGKSALLLEQRDFSKAVWTGDAGVVRRWVPPALQTTPPGATLDDVWHQLIMLMSGEVKLGSQVIAIDACEHRLQIATGDSFVYDKLISTLRLEDLQRLILDEHPRCIRGIEWWRCWLSGRDIELLDENAQSACGDIDAEAAGKRIANSVRRAMAAKYSSLTARTALFQPRVVGVAAPGA